MQPIKLHKVGRKIVMTLSNGKILESSVTPYGISCASILVAICECEGITIYPTATNCNAQNLEYFINNSNLIIPKTSKENIHDVAVYIENLRSFIDKALIISEETTV